MDENGLNTVCTHLGAVKDNEYKGVVSPLYMSTSYAFEDVAIKRYPRYFNTPNQGGLCKKMAALEHTETALIFGSGMAAISTALMTFLQVGDHVVLQQTIYGGTYNLAVSQLEKFGIAYSFTKGWTVEDFEREIRPNTKVIYFETPSNPLLTITDLNGISKLAKKHGAISIIDNTFASPVNQNPADFGIDVICHSATKYMGGHSDICAGVVASSKANMDSIYQTAICFGGSLSDYTVWLLERSMKTMGIRVKAQSDNAMKMATYLTSNIDVENVYYPGLQTHPEHELAKSQMKDFGGMLSFELNEEIEVSQFFKHLKLIKPSMSLAGLESTISSPVTTSHALMSPEARKEQGIRESLVRFSLGIEEVKDLIEDVEQAITKVKSKTQPV